MEAKTRTNRFMTALVMAILAATILLALVATPQAKAAFSGENGNVVFQRDGNIWLTGPNGARQLFEYLLTNLTPNTPSQDVDPSISPGGRRVAFTSDRDGDFEIFTLDIYSGTLTKVTNNSVRDAQPTWSPDGRRIAYESPTSATGRTDTDIWTKNASGTGPATDITAASTDNDQAPAWRPFGGDEIAFETGVSRDVVVIDLAGGGMRLLCSGPAQASCLHPSWSPDGTRIVRQYRPDASSDFEIYTMDSSDGTDVRQLTDNSFEDGDAAYSPDGTRITFIRNPFGDYQIFTMSSQDDGISDDEIPFVNSGTGLASPDWGISVPPPLGCTTSGTFAGDEIVGGNTNDSVCSLGGNDEVFGLYGNDILKGGPGRDALYGDAGGDNLLGGGGRDILDSRDNVNRNDRLNGGPGRDRCTMDAREASVRSCP